MRRITPSVSSFFVEVQAGQQGQRTTLAPVEVSLSGLADPGLSWGFKKIFKRAVKAVAKPVKAVAKPVAAVAKPVAAALKKVDPSSSKSVFGAKTATVFKPVAKFVVKPAIATAAAVVTGGASILAGEKKFIPKDTFGLKPTATGAAIGAAVGGAILVAPAAAAALKAAAPAAIAAAKSAAPNLIKSALVPSKAPAAAAPLPAMEVQSMEQPTEAPASTNRGSAAVLAVGAAALLAAVKFLPMIALAGGVDGLETRRSSRRKTCRRGSKAKRCRRRTSR
jgi:hypothetical protein